jgi:hypothetical protein
MNLEAAIERNRQRDRLRKKHNEKIIKQFTHSTLQ